MCSRPTLAYAGSTFLFGGVGRAAGPGGVFRLTWELNGALWTERQDIVVAMKPVDISDAPHWVFGHAGLDSIRVKAQSNRPLFNGIARTADLDRYLRMTEHDDVANLNYHPFQVNYDHTAGYAPPAAPADELFWVRSVSGTGNVALHWKVRPGNRRAVVMNADGSRDVAAELQFGARTSMLWWIGAGRDESFPESVWLVLAVRDDDADESHLSGRDGTGLVEDDRVNAPRRHEHLRPLDQQAELRAASGTDEQRRWCRDPERARAGDDQNGDGGGEGESRTGAFGEPEPERDDGEGNDDGGEDAGDPVGEALHAPGTAGSAVAF